MLRITLYKNCILNETYQNVISTAIKNGKSVLERYLETLNSYQLSDLEDVYYENSGTLNFDLELVNLQDIYQYNYMKIKYYDEDENLLLVRYCFIQNIEVKNEIVYLSYEEDVFSSYSSEIRQITESYLSKSRKLRYSNKTINLHTLSLEYTGNNDVNIQSLDSIDRYSILLKVQYYNTESFGNSNKRFYKTALISIPKIIQEPSGEGEHTTPGIINFVSRLTIDECLETIKYIYSSQSQKGYFNKDLNDLLYYRVESISIIPYNLVSLFNIQSSVSYINPEDIRPYVDGILININDIWHIGNKVFPCCFHYIKDTAKNKISNIHNKTIANNFKRISVGTFNHQIETMNNGTNIELDINLYLDEGNYFIYLNTMNQNIDVTNDFIYEIPFDVVNGETLALQRMENTLQRIQSVFGFVTSVSSAVSDELDEMKKPKPRGRNAKMKKAGIVGAIIDVGLKASANLSINAQKMQIAFNKEFSATEGNFAISSGILNATLGVVNFTINSDNDNFVLKSINNFGYDIYEFCNTLSDIDFYNVNQFVTDNINYDVIKFENINVIGNFPRNVALELNSIFENGFKIWYNENLQDDNLGVR